MERGKPPLIQAVWWMILETYGLIIYCTMRLRIVVAVEVPSILRRNDAYRTSPELEPSNCFRKQRLVYAISVKRVQAIMKACKFLRSVP